MVKMKRRDFLKSLGPIISFSGMAHLAGDFDASKVFASIPGNPTHTENAKIGTTGWQLSNPATNHEIEGYASLTSVNRGQQIQLFVNTVAPTYTIEVFRMGWYNGRGARRLTNPVSQVGRVQPIPTPNSTTGLIECNWTNPYVLAIPYNASDPTEWASGVYLAKLTAGGSGKQSYIIFVVRDDARASDYLFQSSVTTFQAYNNWGGKSLYAHNSTNSLPAVKVSFNRPYALNVYDLAAGSGVGAGEFLTNVQPSDQTEPAGWEYNMVRFLEREGYDVTYATNVDTHTDPDLLLPHRGFLSVGHDEYWSWQMRKNVETYRDRGVSLGFFSANTCYWQIRFEASKISGAPNRTIVAYKEKFYNDPYYTDSISSNNYLVTTEFRNSPVNRPEDALIGVMYLTNPAHGNIVIDDAAHWVCAGTGSKTGNALPGLLGYEVDALQGNAPMGTARVGHSIYTTIPQGHTRYSDMTLYTAASGAKVFATGSIQWSWGLDDYNVPRLRSSVLNSAAQQMTRNVLASFVGAQPQSPMSSLPSQWDNQDIGTVGLLGSASYSGGVFRINGSGTGFAGAADSFHFVYQPWSGDVEIIVSVTSILPTSVVPRIGVMFRETLAPGSRQASMLVSNQNFDTRFIYRQNTNGGFTYVSGGIVYPLHYLKLVRKGNTFSGFRSTDGVTWTKVGSIIITMAASGFVGLAVTSLNNQVLATATLQDVRVS